MKKVLNYVRNLALILAVASVFVAPALAVVGNGHWLAAAWFIAAAAGAIWLAWRAPTIVGYIAPEVTIDEVAKELPEEESKAVFAQMLLDLQGGWISTVDPDINREVNAAFERIRTDEFQAYVAENQANDQYIEQ